MGKYIRKAKAAGELAVMEVTQSSLGVRTRAKTLAASQRLQKSSSSLAASASLSPAAANSSSASYLQLRSRRLLKPPILVRGHDSKPRQKKDSCATSPNARGASSRLRVGSTESVGSFMSTSSDDPDKKKRATGGDETREVGFREKNDGVENDKECSNGNVGPAFVGGVGEASFGDNVLEFEGRERSTRESTPCSLMRDPEAVRTPSSTTRPSSLTQTNGRIHHVDRRHFPTSHEMDEFFAGAEEEQQRSFIEKYNFDPVNDKPLPGRYEWEKLDP